MENWQWGLVLLVVAWALQAAGTWKQMRHYREVMGDITRRWPDGWLGVGNARGGLRKGVIAVVVATRDDAVRRVLLMEGRSVFAKFASIEGVEGLPLDRLSSARFLDANVGRRTAVDMAVAQIQKARSKAAGAHEDGVGAPAEDDAPDTRRGLALASV
ncbi:MAG: transcriptional regulator GutM [Rhizobiaceae bacterium]|nr:transcriptional regulator GutM [Rhizobiaceae bacterium]